MRILITGAGSNIGKGLIPRLIAAGHELVLSDLNKLPDTAPFAGLPFAPCDVQVGFGLERAAEGCDLVLHLPAWHGIHSGSKTEVDFWRLNVDGTFWAFQAAKAAGITRFVFLSSQAWHGHYDKYGFTKRIGEELCEYHRRGSGIRYVAIRPADLTPWGTDWVNRYGARLLRGGVDREDVLDCVVAAVGHLAHPLPGSAEPEGIVANAVRANAFTAADLDGWEDDPLAACERLFPGSRILVEKYGILLPGKLSLSDAGEGAAVIGYAPKRHFGTFLEALKRLDRQGGPDAVRAVRCHY
ncbi:MAG: NAD(P)-dependent oxidoreductase [Cytophagales bacterium]|nr:NAD(P)-dependent oxidoreductase [Armatimonadota bacterium]